MNNLDDRCIYLRSISCRCQRQEAIVGTIITIADYLHCVPGCWMLHLHGTCTEVIITTCTFIV